MHLLRTDMPKDTGDLGTPGWDPRSMVQNGHIRPPIWVSGTLPKQGPNLGPWVRPSNKPVEPYPGSGRDPVSDPFGVLNECQMRAFVVLKVVVRDTLSYRDVQKREHL